MTTCQICKNDQFKLLLDFGSQPLCNRFLKRYDTQNEFIYPLMLGQCEFCGLIQLMKTVPNEEIFPRFDWLIYNEPEKHLDHIANIISKLPDIDEKPVACGVTYKDDSLLERLTKNNFYRTWRIDPEKDLGTTVKGAGGETVQALLNISTAKRLIDSYGETDVIIARHIYEHAFDTSTLIDALKSMLSPNGYIVFEVPDCTKLLETLDYSMPWEEHVLYFTPETFYNSFGYNGLSLIYSENYSYPIENALIAIVKRGDKSSSGAMDIGKLNDQLYLGNLYEKGFNDYSERVKQYLKQFREREGKIAIFGAGHLACMHINLKDIKDEIEFVVDDNSNKRGLFMPGSRLPIVSSDSLMDKNIKLCLMSLSPESEEKVIKNNQKFLENGGIFLSIFPASESHLNI